MNKLSPVGWFVFVVIAIVAFCYLILPMTAMVAFLLLAAGMAVEVAMPVAFVFAAIYIIVCIVRGAMK